MHKVVELSQLIVVEKTVMKEYELETKNTLNGKCLSQEISARSCKRTVLSSSSSSSLSNLLERTAEPISVESTSAAPPSPPEGECLGGAESDTDSKASQLPLPEPARQRPQNPQSEMDFSVPYNIINNYFSVGVVSLELHPFVLDKHKGSSAAELNLLGRRNLRKVSLGARAKSTQIQQQNEEQIVVLRVCDF